MEEEQHYYKPKFNEKLFEKLIENTPTDFETPFGNIHFRQEFVKNILIDIRDMYKFEYDVIQAAQGDEGSGKTHFMAQVAFVYHYFMFKLGLINYDWGLDVCYFSLNKMNHAFTKFRDNPFKIYILDEGDELSGENYWNPNNKQFRSELRRGRKFSRLIFINLPQLKELSSRIVTTRCQKLYEVEVARDTKNYNIKRGLVRVFGIPRGSRAFSFVKDDFISKNKIRNTISNLMKAKEDFIKLPNDILLFTLNYNGTHVWDQKLYKQKALRETSMLFKNAYVKTLSRKEAQIILTISSYLGNNKLTSDCFNKDDTRIRAYYRLIESLNKIESDVTKAL